MRHLLGKCLTSVVTCSSLSLRTLHHQAICSSGIRSRGVGCQEQTEKSKRRGLRKTGVEMQRGKSADVSVATSELLL